MDVYFIDARTIQSLIQLTDIYDMLPALTLDARTTVAGLPRK
jgi:hypothetical protein